MHCFGTAALWSWCTTIQAVLPVHRLPTNILRRRSSRRRPWSMCGCSTTSSWRAMRSARWPSWASCNPMGLRAHFSLLMDSALCAGTGEGGAWPVFTGSTGGSGPFPCPGIAVIFPSRCAGTSPLDELVVGPLSPLRWGPVPPARSSPRSPAKPEAGPLGSPDSTRPGRDRSGSNAAPVAALGVTPFAEPPLLDSSGRLRFAGRPKRLWQRVPGTASVEPLRRWSVPAAVRSTFTALRR